MPNALSTYQKRLTNLSAANKSLLLLRAFQRQYLDLHTLDHLEGASSFQIIQALLRPKANIALTTQIDSRQASQNQASVQLKYLQRNHLFLQEETGADYLAVGYPFVEGKWLDGTPVRCPLLFFPVSLHAENNKWKIRSSENKNIAFNHTFLLAYNS